jgi:hypothetical protein
MIRDVTRQGSRSRSWTSSPGSSARSPLTCACAQAQACDRSGSDWALSTVSTAGSPSPRPGASAASVSFTTTSASQGRSRSFTSARAGVSRHGRSGWSNSIRGKKLLSASNTSGRGHARTTARGSKPDASPAPSSSSGTVALSVPALNSTVTGIWTRGAALPSLSRWAISVPTPRRSHER